MPEYTFDVDDLREAVRTSHTIAEVLSKLQTPSGCNWWSYRKFHAACEEHGIDYSHFDSRAYRAVGKRGRPPEEWLVLLPPGSTRVHGSRLRKCLLALGVEYRCTGCGRNKWRGKHLVLEVDHANGNPLDNRRENLRFLCGNCHSQTEYFRNYSTRRPDYIPPDVPEKLCECGRSISRAASRCMRCAGLERVASGVTPRRLIVTPEQLEKLVWEMPASHVGAMYGVSGGAVAKRCKQFGITPPGRGYWAKQAAGR